MKDELRTYKEISSDAAAAAYIETFAIKVFQNADNEDRRGGSNRNVQNHQTILKLTYMTDQPLRSF